MATDFAVLSTLDQEVHVMEANNWGDAVATYIQGVDLSYQTLFGCRDTDPYPHWTIDVYGDEIEETVIVMHLDDLDVEDPHSLPAPTRS